MNASSATRSVMTRSARHRRPWRTRTALAITAALACVPAVTVPAHAFGPGTHTKITESALGGFQKKSLEAMAAGDLGDDEWGAIRGSDKGDYYPKQTRYHCDDADYLKVSGYPRSRQQATDELLACIQTSVEEFHKAVVAAGELVDSKGHINTKEVGLDHRCKYNDSPGRAKCTVFEHLGRAWHAIEDFYSHSNWTDQKVPEKDISVTNPPGLQKTTPAPFFTLRAYSNQSTATWEAEARKEIGKVPDVATGCAGGEYEHGSKDLNNCNRRINHYDDADGKGGLSKEGSRAKIDHNGDNAEKVATEDIKRQWQDFQDELLARYSNGHGKKMICTLTHDAPTDATCK
ncbi:hypothetical protein ACFY4B_42180 [Kitasatospora sp. NPDC001261]|uniref:hypothetical protein n=1 Tax=Kitasatospora sp. NPDC001261 TaxID=3364012 RepID=UPI0036820C1D